MNKMTPLAEWTEAERIRDLPEVDEALRNFLEDAPGDNATCIVRAVMRAATAGVKETAAGLIERLRAEGCTPDQIAAELADAGLDSEADAAGLTLAAGVTAPELTEQAAYDMGAKGAPATERERLLFEAWMRGHCWALCATWGGKQYVSDAEQGGDLDPRAMATRRLFAAWRDRAALGVPGAPAPGPKGGA